VCPVLKGNLFLQIEGDTVNARFNNVLAFTVNQVRALLTKALPGLKSMLLVSKILVGLLTINVLLATQ